MSLFVLNRGVDDKSKNKKTQFKLQIMKKSIFLIPVLGLIISCADGTKQKKESSEISQKQTEKIEESIQELDTQIQNSEVRMENTQKEIDSLLNNI